MRHVRVTLRPEREAAPAFFTYLSDASGVDEVRVADWNMAAPDVASFLYAIEGEAPEFPARARETPGVESVSVVDADEPVTYALVATRKWTVPLFSAATEAVAQAGLVVSKPMVYRDWEILVHAVGEPGAIQTAFEEVPAGMAAAVDEIGQFPCHRAAPTTNLTDRQHEAVEAALDLGYYDQPRGATHEDVAAELGCAPATASEHLQKAEAELVRLGMDAFDPV